MAEVTTPLATATVSETAAASILASTTVSNGIPGPTSRAGIFEGVSPVLYNPSNPVILFIVQAAIIIIFCRLLQYPLSRLGQPRVVAEVIGGILLGPSVMMRIPGFKNAIFPDESKPVLNNVANLGILIYLFLIALSIDTRLFRSNWRASLSVWALAMIFPFGLGFAIANGLYKEFDGRGDLNISFGLYGFFLGTAMSTTAFSILCRILPELKILNTHVGVTVLAAGMGNDVTGWILLALCVSLVNNNNGLSTLWALLSVIGWILVLVFVIRPGFLWVMKRSGSIQNGPTQGMVALTMLIILLSAWFTGIIGLHPVFGAFVFGLVCPRDGGFAIKLTEKIEDIVSVFFVPLYFAYSGLSTDLGLLDTGITWAYIFGLIAIAWFGNIIGGGIAARLNKFGWRESLTVGVLMSCNGLMELIVLNIGLQSRILSDRTFTMLIVMALVTTISVTPLTKIIFPSWYQKKLERWRKGETDRHGNPLILELSSDPESTGTFADTPIKRALIYLRLDSLPSLFTFVALLGDPPKAPKPKPNVGKSDDLEADSESQPSTPRKPPLEVHGLRILAFSERASSFMQMTDGEDYSSIRDPIVNAFRIFSRLNDLSVSGKVAVVPMGSYAETLTAQAADMSSDFALVPWSEHGSMVENQMLPLETSSQDRFQGKAHIEFVQKTLKLAVCNIGVFINKGFGGPAAGEGIELRKATSALSMRTNRDERTPSPIKNRMKSHQIFLPFFGGVDDRVALRFAMQLVRNPYVTVTVANIDWPQEDFDDTASAQVVVAGGSSSPATQSSPWPRWPSKRPQGTVVEQVSALDTALVASMESSIPQQVAARVRFISVTVSSANVLEEALAAARESVGNVPNNAGDIVIVGRRHQRLGDLPIDAGGPDLKTTVGILAEKVVMSDLKASVLVVQAGGRGYDG